MFCRAKSGHLDQLTKQAEGMRALRLQSSVTALIRPPAWLESFPGTEPGAGGDHG